MDIILSFLVSRIRVVNVAMVSQPSPSTMGNTALPFKPITLNNLLTITASLGRYPLSSINPKLMKKNPTMGNMIAME